MPGFDSGGSPAGSASIRHLVDRVFTDSAVSEQPARAARSLPFHSIHSRTLTFISFLAAPRFERSNGPGGRGWPGAVAPASWGVVHDVLL